MLYLINFYQYYEVIHHYTRALMTCSVSHACRSVQNLALEANANDTFRAAYLFLADVSFSCLHHQRGYTLIAS